MQTNWKLEPLLKFSDSNKYVHPPCTTCRRSLYPALTLSLFQSNKAIRPSVVRKLKHIDNYFNCRSIVTKFDELNLFAVVWQINHLLSVSQKHGSAQTFLILNCIFLTTILLDKTWRRRSNLC